MHIGQRVEVGVDGTTSPDIQEWVTGTPDTSGLLRSERSGTLYGRIYTIRYDVTSNAGVSQFERFTGAAITRSKTSPGTARTFSILREMELEAFMFF